MTDDWDIKRSTQGVGPIDTKTRIYQINPIITSHICYVQ